MDTLHKILQLMWDKGISDMELCRSAGINKSAVTDWKKGKTQSYMKHLPEIAKALDVTVDELTTEKEKPTGVSADELDEALKKVSEIASTLSEKEKQMWIEFGEMLLRSQNK